MTTDEATEIITSSPQYRELLDALEEAKKQPRPEEWQEVSVAQRSAEPSGRLGEGKSFERSFINHTPAVWRVISILL